MTVFASVFTYEQFVALSAERLYV